MKINELFETELNFEITGIVDDSRDVKDGYLFVATKGFNVDHLHCIRNYEYTEEFTGIDVHDISNLMPSCGSCNRYKATMDLETFRKQLQKIPDRLKRDICTYNIALRYGMVQENREPIKFYFEKVGESDAN